MKKFIGVLVLQAFLPACNVTPKQVENALIDEASATCVVLHADLDDPTVNTVCAIEQALVPFVKSLLSTTRAKASLTPKAPDPAKLEGIVAAERARRQQAK